MLNEERIVLMTQMASYEKKQGKEHMVIGKYFHSDYVGAQVLKSVFSAAISYLACFALYVLYHFEELMENIYEIDLITFAKKVLIYFVVIVVAYGAVTYVVSTVRYARAKKSLKSYYQNLKKLNAMYEE